MLLEQFRISIYDSSIRYNALAQFGSTSVDFVDCLLAAQAQQKNLTVYSFDEKDFPRLGVAWEAPA